MAFALAGRLKHYGCVKIGLGPRLVEDSRETLRRAEAFFALPQAQKDRARATVKGGAGYNPVKSETYDGSENYALREFYAVNRALPQLEAETPFFSIRSRLSETPMGAPLGRLYEELDRLLMAVARAIAVACGAPDAFFDDMLRDGVFSTRVFRYPAGSATQNPLGLISHRDAGFLAILLGVTAPGLEVRDPRTGRFAPASPREDEAVLLTGESMEIATGGALPAAVHRARAASPGGGDRLSIAGFMAGNAWGRVKLMRPDIVHWRLGELGAASEMTPLELLEERLGAWTYHPEYAGYDADCRRLERRPARRADKCCFEAAGGVRLDALAGR